MPYADVHTAMMGSKGRNKTRRFTAGLRIVLHGRFKIRPLFSIAQRLWTFIFRVFENVVFLVFGRMFHYSFSILIFCGRPNSYSILFFEHYQRRMINVLSIKIFDSKVGHVERFVHPPDYYRPIKTFPKSEYL